MTEMLKLEENCNSSWIYCEGSTRSEKAKGLGKAGFLEVQIKSVTPVDGQEVYLSVEI